MWGYGLCVCTGCVQTEFLQPGHVGGVPGLRQGNHPGLLFIHAIKCVLLCVGCGAATAVRGKRASQCGYVHVQLPGAGALLHAYAGYALAVLLCGTLLALQSKV
jgi:hypothetical protein